MCRKVNNIFRIMLVVAVLMAVCCCTRETFPDIGSEDSVPEGFVAVSFDVSVPDMTTVATRAVDQDNLTGIRDIRLFCFNRDGYLIQTVTPTGHTETPDAGNPDVSTSGKFKAAIPSNTKIVHFVANQNWDNFHEFDVIGGHENSVIREMVASSGKLIYWSRIEAVADADGNFDIKSTLSANVIRMIRNQARVKVAIGTDEAGSKVPFEVDGFFVCNTSAWGTIAPYNDATGKFEWSGTLGDMFLTLPDNHNRLSAPDDVDRLDEQFVFETENTLANPVSVIILGRNKPEDPLSYFRVLLLGGEDSEPLPVVRNYSYNLNIVGDLAPAYPTMQDALSGAATNNIWISISDDINTIVDGENVLSVDSTYVIRERPDEGPTSEEVINFQYTENGKGAAVAPTVDWVEGEFNNVALSDINYDPSVHYDKETGKGTATVYLRSMGDEVKREGTLLVKKGRLQRKIKIITVKTMDFEPAWITANAADGAAGEKITMMFTIPETTPEELFPMNVLITAKDLDIRSESGMKLDIVTKESDPELFGNPIEGLTDLGYKYVYPVDAPGIQRVYFETVFHQNESADSVFIEADYFNTLKKIYTLTDGKNEILLPDMQVYAADSSPDFPDDEGVRYLLVPQKVNAPVKFQMALQNGEGEVQMTSDDEFLLYSQNLTNVDLDGDPFEFVPVDDSKWGSGGRVFGFYLLPETAEASSYTVTMATNCPNSQEVVRLSSNQPGELSVKGSGDYNGKTFRSTTFELANYRPFEFSSSISAGGSTPVTAGDMGMTYEYEQEVAVSFDITDFTAQDGLLVDPFGTAFDVYIDAPMLKIDEGDADMAVLVAADKLKEVPEGSGHFVYSVDADRDEEAKYGTYERKTLYFKTNKIVSAGDISISADPSVVIFNKETYSLSNLPITGNITYGDSNTPVGHLEFVSFERSRDGTRIGYINVISEGVYELRLRAEYSYNWGDDRIEFNYRKDGKNYTAAYGSLSDLFKAMNDTTPKVVLMAE